MVCEAIDSVLAQTVRPAQVIVVDDGSITATGDALARYGDKIIYHYKPNAGLSAARNTGIRLSTQPYIAFLDDDDVWAPRKTELQMECLLRDPDIGMIATRSFDWPCESFPQAPLSIDNLLHPVTWEQLVVQTLIPVASVIVRRDVVERVGDFDVALRSSEDREFFLRVAEVAKVAILEAPLSGYRDTPGSMCKQADGRESMMREILRRLDRRDAWRGRRALRRKAFSYMHMVCADAQSRAGNHAGAIRRLVQSLIYHPFPYARDEVRMRYERPKRLAVNVLRAAGLKKSDAAATGRKQPSPNALRESAANQSPGTNTSGARPNVGMD